MPKRLFAFVLLCAGFSVIACNLVGASAPTLVPTALDLGGATATTIIVKTAQPSVTLVPSAVPPTVAPPAVVTNCSASPKPQLAIGMTARVSPGTANNVRAQPSKASALVTTIPAGQEVEVVGGTVCADGFQWWQVKAPQLQGWTVEGSGSSYWLVPAMSVPATVALPAGGTSQSVSYSNVSFTFTAALTDHVLARTVFAAPHDPDMPFFLDTSQRLEFTLNGFDYTSSTRPKLLTVFKISDLEASDARYTPMVDAMRAMLTQQPAVAATSSISTPITVIPVQNAAQDFHAQARYFRFQSGIGLRFVTYYTQGPGPVDNQSLVYVFQGLTDDGLYYISALIPITTANISQLPAWQAPADATAMNTYLTQVAQKVDTFGAKDFAPALDDLDAWLTSVRVQ